MDPNTIPQFLAAKLPGSGLKLWDMAPKRFDFEISYHRLPLQQAEVKSWAEEAAAKVGAKLSLDDNLIGATKLNGLDYVVAISNFQRFRLLRGTFERF